ncbi:hypothetical protein B0I35DRAFT_483614 [Stachybotrys elegans]|uniref:Zn(2)-C6 fungal-type domain-containing protein n=1 Tax=Stachybotrys elegans TaxID=80388 RepID=A0A8K0SJW0_9HYPO|nr:hypothetical protein B0I35DRAFT_483614 [Stachybotrys elegans]
MPRSKAALRVAKHGTLEPVGKPRGRRRDRDCQTCKQREVKCDLNRPSCGQCAAANTPCQGYLARVVWVVSDSSPSVPPSPRSRKDSAADQETIEWNGAEAGDTSNASDLRGPTLLDAHNVDWSGKDRNSFIRPLVATCQHIIQLGGDALRQGENRYLSPEVISLISRLRDFAQARIDTHPNQSGSPVTWESEEASRHRLEALVGLKETLAVGNPFALVGIAAFAFFEVCDSGFGQWQRHLLGAKSLLDCHCTCSEELDQLSQEVTGLKVIVARLVWFDTIGAIGRGTSDMIFDAWHRDMLDQDFFRTVGCPGDTFRLFARVAAGEMTTDAPTVLLHAMRQLLELEQGETDWELSANVYRCAAVIAVLAKASECHPASTIAGMMASAVDRACRVLAALAPTSQFYIHLAVPAYLAGMNATTLEQCEAVRSYWRGCNHAGVRRYPDGLARCEEHWKAKGLVAGDQ